jgi:hypothetical protein
MLIAPSAIFAQDDGKRPGCLPWNRHVIDDSSRGADGVRLADVNKDGRLDITTGWEEGGVTRVYIHPGHDAVRANWPAVTVGKTTSVEDAVFCDLDSDGAVDVISSCEGRTRCMFVHWAPKQSELYLHPDEWKTDAIPATRDKTAWMFALPLQIDGKDGLDLVVASKGKEALVGWLQSPAHPRDLDSWKLHTLYRAGWVMSLVSTDVDGDDDLDLIVSDRKGPNSGVLWLENPGPQTVEGPWPEHRIGGSGREVMFLDVADLDRDGHRDVIAAVKPDEIHWFRRPSDPTQPWTTHIIKVSLTEGTGTAKGVRVGDIDGDGRLDIVYSCERATAPKRGLVWLSYSETPNEENWSTHDISGPEGIKYDRVELLDLDGDGDLDVLTCEEKHNGKGIGVFWHENPFGTSHDDIETDR